MLSQSVRAIAERDDVNFGERNRNENCIGVDETDADSGDPNNDGLGEVKMQIILTACIT
jgi:hypothetical protein